MKVIIVGLDALNMQLVEKCKEEMPNIYRHMNEGCSGTLRTVFPYFTGSTWSSFQTGKKIGNHGIFNYYKFNKNLEPSFFTGSDLKEKCFYEYFDEEGIKCFLMNLPYTDPPRIRGDIIFSWIFAMNDINKAVYPASLLERFPTIKNYRNYAERSGGVVKYLKNAHGVFLSQADVIKEVIASKEHEVMFFLLEAPDMVQHKAFCEIINGKNNRRARIGKRILSEIDELIGWIDANKEKDSAVFIISDHGFKEYEGKFFVNSFLKKEGYLITNEEGQELRDTIKKPAKKGKVDISKLIVFVKRHPFLLKIGEMFYDVVINRIPVEFVKQAKIDAKNSRAYCRSGFDNIIFINENIAGSAREELKNELINKINKFDGVYAEDCDKFFKGRYRNGMGDVVVIGEDYEVDNTIGDRIFLKMKRPMHDMEGMLIAYGQNIRKNWETKGAYLYDVVPSIFHLFGFEVPSDMDGKVIKGLFERDVPVMKKINIERNKEKEMLDEAIGNIDTGGVL